MQYLKDEIRNSLEEQALIEFKTWGYNGASMRSISKNAGTSVGNLYKYFKNKDELYKVVIGSVYHQAMDCIDLFSKVEIDEQAEAYFYSLMGNIMDLIDSSCSKLSILLNKSQGSKYENCKTSFVNVITEIVTGMMNYKLALKNETLKDNFMIFLLSRNLVESIAVILDSKTDHAEIRNLILSLINILYENLEDKLPELNITEGQQIG